MTKTISILGLGWLGLPLAESLLTKGFTVKGSVTSPEKVAELAASGIDVSVIKLEEKSMIVSNPSFFKTDVLFINIPPRRIPDIETVYPAQIEQLLPHILSNKIEKVIFVSSTSVYPEVNQIAIETDQPVPEKGSGTACLFAENALQTIPNVKTTVIRFGGLIGANRNPHRFMQRGAKNGAAQKPVNLIHLDDCIGIIEHIIRHEIWGEIINGSCPVHPTRKEFYQLAAEVAGVEPPEFDETEAFQFKKVSSEKLVNQLGYKFKYNSPTDYLKSLL